MTHCYLKLISFVSQTLLSYSSCSSSKFSKFPYQTCKTQNDFSLFPPLLTAATFNQFFGSVIPFSKHFPSPSFTLLRTRGSEEAHITSFSEQSCCFLMALSLSPTGNSAKHMLRLMSLKHKTFQQKKDKYPNRKWIMFMHKQLAVKKLQMTEKYMKGCSNSLMIQANEN